MTKEDKIIDEIIKYQRSFDEYTLKQIATRLNSTKGLGLVDLFDIAYFSLIYMVMADIDAKMSATRKSQAKELENLLSTSALSSYKSMKSLYEDSGKEYLPLKNNKEVSDYIKSEVTRKKDEFTSMLKHIGYPIQNNLNNKKMFKSPSETYQYIANRAKSEELNNPFGYDVWSSKVMKSLLRDGLKVYNYNQDTHRYKQQNSYSFIRNFVKNAVYQVSQGVFNVVANQVGIDGVEISVHMDCAIDHLPIQGHQFDLTNFHNMQSHGYFEDIEGNLFAPLDRALGTLNCRHYVYPIILGKTEPRYTKEQLDEIKKKTEVYATIETADGAVINMSYSDYNRYVRNLKDKLDTTTLDLHVAEKLGNKGLIEYYKARLAECKSALASFRSKM